MAPPPQQQPRNTPNNSQDPLSNAIDQARRAADTVVDTATRAKPLKTARAMSQVARALVKTNQNILSIDKAMTDLESAAPGTMQSIKEVSATLKQVSDIVPVRNVPNGLKPVAKDAQQAVKSFDSFVKDYDSYQKTPATSWRPSTWGAKSAAGVKAVQSWNQAKRDIGKLQDHAPAPLKDPAVQRGVGDAVEKTLDILDRILK